MKDTSGVPDWRPGDEAAAKLCFHRSIAELTARIAGAPLDEALDARLNAEAGPGSPWFRDVFAQCRRGVEEGWLCENEHGGIRYGRPFDADPALHGYSVDVVEMQDISGPHHFHPNGEIDLIMPLEGQARFDGRHAGWCVYAPGTAHRPTVEGGTALILYLLPEGRIEFTRKARSAAVQP